MVIGCNLVLEVEFLCSSVLDSFVAQVDQSAGCSVPIKSVSIVAIPGMAERGIAIAVFQDLGNVSGEVLRLTV